MPFFSLPAQLKVPTRTPHTELLAVFGENGERFRDNNIYVSLAGETLHFQLKQAKVPAETHWTHSASTWSWGAPTAAPVTRTGRLFAARADGLVVTEWETNDKEQALLEVWRGAKKVRTIVGPKFGMFEPEGNVIHGQLVVSSRVEGLVVINLDEDTPNKVFARQPKDEMGYQPGFTTAEAPDHGIVLCDGSTLATHDLRTGKKRSEVKGPAHLYMSRPVLSPDARVAVVCTEQRSSVKRPKDGVAAGFLALDLETGQVLAALNEQKPWPRGAAFILGGRAVVTASNVEGSIALWDATTWKLLERIELEKGTDYASPEAVFAWDAHDAFVYRGLNGHAFVFKASLEPLQAGVAAKPAKTKQPGAVGIGKAVISAVKASKTAQAQAGRAAAPAAKPGKAKQPARASAPAAKSSKAKQPAKAAPVAKKSKGAKPKPAVKTAKRSTRAAARA
ncbi:hypothetical protein ACLESD_31980 [Pyxidicoccus sp. 3LFB2]